MPLEELLALYGYREMQENESPIEEDQEQSEPMDEQESEPDPPEQSSKLRVLYDNMPDTDPDASRLLRCIVHVFIFVNYRFPNIYFYSCFSCK